jgi:hypothetical protein
MVCIGEAVPSGFCKDWFSGKPPYWNENFGENFQSLTLNRA